MRGQITWDEEKGTTRKRRNPGVVDWGNESQGRSLQGEWIRSTLGSGRLQTGRPVPRRCGARCACDGWRWKRDHDALMLQNWWREINMWPPNFHQRENPEFEHLKKTRRARFLQYVRIKKKITVNYTFCICPKKTHINKAQVYENIHFKLEWLCVNTYISPCHIRKVYGGKKIGGNILYTQT